MVVVLWKHNIWTVILATVELRVIRRMKAMGLI